jgi:hypothetical protein
MRDTRDPGVIFAEFLSAGLNRGQVDEPQGPRAPRPDYSQGSSLTAPPEPPGQAFERMLLALRYGSRADGHGAWREIQ